MKSTSRVRDNSAYNSVKEAPVQLGASIFAARIINNMAAMTIELSSHVEPKSSPSSVTALVSNRRKAAPIKNNCQSNCPHIARQYRTGSSHRRERQTTG